jgi:hypothetical protein
MWMAEDSSDEMWAGAFPMWKKRVLTQWAGKAWDELCKTFNFTAAARKIGMLMTVDGTNDDLICIDGVDKYTFPEADAGDLPVTERSDDDGEEEEEEEEDDEEQLLTRTSRGLGGPRSMIWVTVTTQGMIQLIPTKYYHLLVQRRLRCVRV